MPHAVVSVHVDASAEAVFDLVADPMRMAEWSPETVKTVWRKGATRPAVGATFRGTNAAGKARWSTDATIVELERPSRFAFEIRVGPLRTARWGYEVAPDADGAGCTVSETWADHRPGAMKAVLDRIVRVPDRKAHAIAGMTETLARVKAAAEATA